VSRYFKIYWDEEKFPTTPFGDAKKAGAWVCPDCGEASKTRRIRHDEHCPRVRRRLLRAERARRQTNNKENLVSKPTSNTGTSSQRAIALLGDVVTCAKDGALGSRFESCEDDCKCIICDVRSFLAAQPAATLRERKGREDQ